MPKWIFQKISGDQQGVKQVGDFFKFLWPFQKSWTSLTNLTDHTLFQMLEKSGLIFSSNLKVLFLNSYLCHCSLIDSIEISRRPNGHFCKHNVSMSCYSDQPSPVCLHSALRPDKTFQ